MDAKCSPLSSSDHRGFSLIELMIALTIGSVLIGGAVTMYSRCRAVYEINDTIARLQEAAQYAFSTLEPDLKLAGFYGLTNDARYIAGALGNAPLTLNSGALECGAEFTLALNRPIAGSNGSYALPCAPGPAGASVVSGSDMVSVRRADIQRATASAERLQIYTSREGLNNRLFVSSTAPGSFGGNPLTDPNAAVHNLIARAYYVSAHSSQRRDQPSLRRKTLQGGPKTGPDIVDQEVMPGVEDMQIQFGIDIGVDWDKDGKPDDRDGDGQVDLYSGTALHYVNADDPLLDRARVVAVKVWLRIRAETAEPGFIDDKQYSYAGVVSFQPKDGFRRLLASRTVYVRNAAGPLF